MPDMFEADGMKASAARLLAIAMRAREHGKCELGDILTVRAAQHLDNAALIERRTRRGSKSPMERSSGSAQNSSLKRLLPDIDASRPNCAKRLARSARPYRWRNSGSLAMLKAMRLAHRGSLDWLLTPGLLQSRSCFAGSAEKGARPP